MSQSTIEETLSTLREMYPEVTFTYEVSISCRNVGSIEQHGIERTIREQLQHIAYQTVAKIPNFEEQFTIDSEFSMSTSSRQKKEGDDEYTDPAYHNSVYGEVAVHSSNKIP